MSNLKIRCAPLLPVFMLTAAQVSQATRNITTNELSNWNRYTYLHKDGKLNEDFVNPFDRGMRKNCVEVCRPRQAPKPVYTADEAIRAASNGGTGERERERERLIRVVRESADDLKEV